MANPKKSTASGEKKLKKAVAKHKQKVTEFERKSREGKQKIVNTAMQWYFNRVRIATGVTPDRQNSYSTVEDIRNGGLFQYTYDPKHADTLPYYDRFPLIVPIRMNHDGWLGLNLHYLPPHLRAAIFDDIINLGSKNKTKLMVAYAWVKAYQKYSIIRHAIKRYLILHVTSPVVHIKMDEWENAVLLPTQSFAKKTDEYVWSDWKM